MPLDLAPSALAAPLRSAPAGGAMRRPLAGRHALVTDSTSGVGLAIARALAASGADLVLHGPLAREPGADLRGRLAAACGARVAHSAADLAAPGAAGKLVAQATRQLGALDIAVVGGERDPASVGALIAAVLPAMTARGWGRVVVVVRPNWLTRGLTALARGAALAGAGRGVTVNLLRLAEGDTAREALGARVVLLCGDEAALLTGAVVGLDAGDSSAGNG